MKTSGLVLDSRQYRTLVMPPLVLEDRSRFGNNGVFANVTWVKLPSGLWAKSFNGASSKVTTPAGVSSMPKYLAVSIWVFISAAPLVSQCIACGATGSAGADGWEISSTANGEIRFSIYGMTGDATTFAATLFTVGWQHIYCTYDGATREIYKNGVSIFSDASVVGEIYYGPAARSIFLGSRNGTSLWFNGLLSLPRINNRAVTPAQMIVRFEQERRWFGV